MAYRNIVGFETGNTLEASSASGATVQGTTKRTGDYALRLNPSASVAIFTVKCLAADGSAGNMGITTTAYFTFYLRLGSLPGSTVRIAEADGISGGNIRISVDSSGNVFLSNWAESADSSTAATLSAGVWYRIDLKAVKSGTCELQVDGGTAVTLSGGVVNIDYLNLGTTASQTMDVYYDDVAVSDSGFPGAGQVNRMDPDGDGALGTGWAGGTGSTFAEVDEVPHDTDTSYWQSTAASDVRTVTLETAASAGVGGAIATVKSVAINRDEGGSSLVAVRLRSGSTNDDTSDRNVGITYALYGKVYDTDPADAGAWTSGDLDALEVGVVNNAAVAARCTELLVMVWSAGATPIDLTPDPVAIPIVLPAPAVTMGTLTLTPSPVAIPIVLPAPTVAVLGSSLVAPAETLYRFEVDWGRDNSWFSTYDDVSADVRYAFTERGWDNQLEAVQAGTAELRLVNTSGRYFPDNTSSPLYGDVRPSVPIRILAAIVADDFGGNN